MHEWKHATQRNNAHSRYGCRKVGYKLFTSFRVQPGSQRSLNASRLLTYDVSCAAPVQPGGEDSHAHFCCCFNSHSGPQECWIQQLTESTTGNGGSVALIGGNSAGVLDLAFLLVEHWAFFFLFVSPDVPRLIDAHISIIYSAPNELLKRQVWFNLFSYSIFNAEGES